MTTAMRERHGGMARPRPVVSTGRSATSRSARRAVQWWGGGGGWSRVATTDGIPHDGIPHNHDGQSSPRSARTLRSCPQPPTALASWGDRASSAPTRIPQADLAACGVSRRSAVHRRSATGTKSCAPFAVASLDVMNRAAIHASPGRRDSCGRGTSRRSTFRLRTYPQRRVCPLRRRHHLIARSLQHNDTLPGALTVSVTRTPTHWECAGVNMCALRCLTTA